MKPLVIGWLSAKRFLRDRMALFFTLVFPVGIILIVGSATSGFNEDTLPIGIVNDGSGPLAKELDRTISRERSVEIERFDDRDDLAKAVRRGEVPAGVVIPADYDAVLASGKDAKLDFLVDQSRGFPAGARSVLARAAARQGSFVQAAHFTVRHADKSFDTSLRDARASNELLTSVRIGVTDERVGRADAENTLAPGIGYQTPSVLLLFVFITSLAGAGAIIQTRRLGVSRRMYGTPTTARQILAGETLGRFIVAGGQALFLFFAGTFLFGVDWGDPLGAFALIVMFVAVGASVGMLVGTIFSTPEQAGSVGPPIGIALGMLGGCMWPLEIVPEPMQAFGHLFPHAWAMDAWIELIGRGGTIVDILPQLGVLAGFVAVLFPLGAWRFRRAILAG